jgi:prevent-host-death family protein
MKYHFCSLTQARKNFSKLISQVEAGETIILTRHGKPIATIFPYDPKQFPV